MYSEAQAECACCLEDAGRRRQSGDRAQRDSRLPTCPSQACAGEGGGVRPEEGRNERQSLPPTSLAPSHVKVICDTGWSREALRLASSSVTLACRRCPGSQETHCGVPPGSGRGPPWGLAWDLQGAELDGGLAETQCLSLVVAKAGSGQVWGRHLILSKMSKRSTGQTCPG